MFTFAGSPFEIPSTIADMCRDTWAGIAMPGCAWSGSDRVAIASRARAARLGAEPLADHLPPAAQEAVRVLAATPAFTSREWVQEVVAAIGEPAYVEVLGLVARVVAVDTFTRLVGVAPEPFPQPHMGQPTAVAPHGPLERDATWVAITGSAVPPNVLSLVPPAQAETNATAEALYMTGAQMESPDTTIDGLHRTQIETVATSVSFANECFY
jgi:hypothetical protein